MNQPETSGVPTAEEHWRSLFEHSPDFIYTVDLDGRITSFNHAGSRPVSVSDLVGKRMVDLAAPANREPLAALLSRVASSGKAEIYEGSFSDPDGRIHYYESRCIPVLRAGAVASFLIVTRDVTPYRQAQEALAASEDRYRAIIEQGPDALCLFDAEGVIRYANESTRRLLDYDPATLRGKTARDFLHPDDHATMRDFEALLAATPGQPLEAKRYRLRHRNGQWRFIETVATNLLHVPSINAIIANYRDVTERVRLEEQLRQSQKMEAIGMLAGGVAHDFNNLLTVIIGFADQAQQTVPGNHPASPLLTNVTRAATTAGELTQKLLTFARRQIRLSQVFDLAETVRSFGDLLRRIVGEDIAIEMRVTEEVLPVKGDPAQLQQVLLNLCTNARHAMPGGGLLQVVVRSLPETSPEGRRCELQVIDSGIGMSDQTRARIFEPFFTTTGGTGLGMSVVFGIVQDHRGSIEVTSALGAGTTVRIELPLHQERAYKRRTTQPKMATGSETLLLAEDEPLVRDLVARALRTMGYTVLEAGDGREAIEVFSREKERIALAILDVIMPRLGGPQAFTEMLALQPK
ncbi:MAG TPA: PAS domain S-box protein, partial [Polyangia bacterium]